MDEAKVLTQGEMMRHRHFVEKIRKMNDIYFSRTGERRTVLCRTYGCQMNAHDSEKIKGMFIEMGYGHADNEKTADVIVYNTCCVRENAENKIFGNLGYLKGIKAGKKDLKILVCGCMTQQDAIVSKIKQTYRHVDIVFGTFNLHRLPELLWTSYETDDIVVDIWKEHGVMVEDLPVERELPFKASVNIMYGCNNFCSYCIVPYVRGRERSRSSADVIAEIKSLAESGVKEVLLLGQNVNSYGAGLSEKIDFAGLLEQVSAIDSIERIRFMTSHPKDLSDRLIYAIRDLDKVCKHVHLPFQAGSNNVLDKMNRKYTREHYISLIDKIKREIPTVALTTDIIIGFPGETEDDFLDTVDMVKYVRFNGAYTFYYSKRTGTPAAVMPEQVSGADAKDRFDRLLDVVNPIVYDINKDYEGVVFAVLAENRVDSGILTGRADNNTLVHFRGDSTLIGEIVNVRIIEGKPFYLMGEVISN